MDPTATPSKSSETGTGAASKNASQAGQLTAGTWDDNVNFDFYTSYLTTTLSSQLAGIPIIDRSARMVIVVTTAAGEPMAGAEVRVEDAANHVFTSTTGAEGRVLFFPGWSDIANGSAVSITASTGNDSAEQPAVAAAGTVTLVLGQTARTNVNALDLAFVIDTTGSMGDELSYVQRQVDTIAGGIAAQFPTLVQRFALILYRDTGDQYVVRSFDFTTDLATFQRNLLAQSADGGGDEPEAVDQALAAAGKLSWQTGATARVAFWIADAPHHVGRENAVVSALQTAVSKAVHVYPIAASGITDLGEFTMRTAAEVTGGRYLFLTDDSGIGNSHAEPHIPCYYVTTLESAIRRMVLTEVTGYYAAPSASEIIRTSGNPQGQQCNQSGTVFTVW
jgi:von Willebrand factor type A domain